ALLRDAARASCISRAVAADVERFAGLVERRARPPLLVRAQPLPTEPFPGSATGAASEAGAAAAAPGDPPLVLCFGSLEPRKNGAALLRAAARIAASGVRLRLVFAGAKGMMNDAFWDTLAAARARGLDVDARIEVSDAALRALYQASRFTAFVSLAEG